MKRKVLVLGVTGGLGSGKSTVASMFRKLGAAVIDADKINHRLLKFGTPVYKEIIAEFGPQILSKNMRIDRKELAELVFNNPRALRRLCRITHPAIIKQIASELSRLKAIKRHPVIVVDAPLLIEAGIIKIIDKLLVVALSRKIQIARCKRKLGISSLKVVKRIKAQMPLGSKIKLADCVIDNSATLPQTKRQVREIWKKLQ